MGALLIEGLHWGAALIPVLVLLAVFVWLDAFALMSLKEIAVLLLLGGARRARRLADQRPAARHAADRLLALQPLRRAVDRGSNQGADHDRALPNEPHRLQARRGHLRLRDRRRLLGRREYLLPDPLPRLTAPEPGWCAASALPSCTARRSPVLAAIAHEFAERETREAAADYDFSLIWFVPGYGVAVALHMAFNQFPDRPLVAMLGAVVIAPIVLIGILSLGTAEAQRWLARRDAPSTAAQVEMRCAPAAGPTGPAGAEDRGTRRPPRRRSREAHPPLLGAAGVAGRRGRGDDDRGSRRRCRVRPGRKSAPPSPSSTA